MLGVRAGLVGRVSIFGLGSASARRQPEMRESVAMKSLWRPVSTVILCGAIFALTPGCLKKEGTKTQKPTSKVTVLGPDTTAARWVDAFREGDFAALKDGSAGDLAELFEEVLRRERVNDQLFAVLRESFPNLTRETFAGMTGNTTRRRILTSTQQAKLDGFLEETAEGARLYQVEHFDEQGRRAYHRLTLQRGADRRWRATGVDDDHFNNAVKIWSRNRNLLFETSLGYLKPAMQKSKPESPQQALQLFGQIAEQVEKEFSGQAK